MPCSSTLLTHAHRGALEQHLGRAPTRCAPATLPRSGQQTKCGAHQLHTGAAAQAPTTQCAPNLPFESCLGRTGSRSSPAAPGAPSTLHSCSPRWCTWEHTHMPAASSAAAEAVTCAHFALDSCRPCFPPCVLEGRGSAAACPSLAPVSPPPCQQSWSCAACPGPAGQAQMPGRLPAAGQQQAPSEPCCWCCAAVPGL